ncbi:MAG: hypothetical protein R6U38_15120 [Desulfatiglandaceae bacterium]
MFDYLLGKAQKKIRDEVCDFVKWVPREMALDMDADRVRFLEAKQSPSTNVRKRRFPRNAFPY